MQPANAPVSKPEVVEEAVVMLQQLGGREFIAMTGARGFMAAGRTDSNPYPWLRMDLDTELQDESTKVNRLKITLIEDEYKVEFYHMELIEWVPEITNQQEFSRVHAEDLRSLLHRLRAM